LKNSVQCGDGKIKVGGINEIKEKTIEGTYPGSWKKEVSEKLRLITHVDVSE